MQIVTKEEMSKVQGGWGYRWNCPQCGYTSAWHMYKNTAQTNARNHNWGTGHHAYWYYS